MASTVVLVPAPPEHAGRSDLVLELYEVGGTSLLNTGGDTLTELTNNDATFTATVTEALSGLKQALIVDTSNNPIGSLFVYLQDDTGTYVCGEYAMAAVQRWLSTTPAALADTDKVQASVAHYTVGTAQTGDSFARLGAPAGASVSADIAAIEAQTDDIGVAGAGLSAIPWNAAWDSEVQSEVDDALKALGLDHLVSASVTGTDVADNSIFARLVSASATADWDDFVQTTDSLQAIRDRGDSAWATATGFSTHAAADVWTVGTRTLTSAANITSTGGTTAPQTGDSFARLGAPAGASVSADVAAVKTDTGNLVTRITSTLFSGITSLAEWLGLLAGKQTGDATARTELRATGAGSGTFDETRESLEALRDQGDAAWATATGFSTHSAADVWAVTTRTLTAFSFEVTPADGSITAAKIATDAIDADALAADAVTEIQAGLSTLDAAGVRTAVGLASANLDTQLAALPTATENATAVLTTQMTESYNADGVAPTLAQAIFVTMQRLTEFSIASQTITVKQLDGSTTAYTLTMDSASNPTSSTRST